MDYKAKKPESYYLAEDSYGSRNELVPLREFFNFMKDRAESTWGEVLTKGDFAELFGISLTDIWRYETGKCNPSTLTIEKIINSPMGESLRLSEEHFLMEGGFRPYVIYKNEEGRIHEGKNLEDVLDYIALRLIQENLENGAGDSFDFALFSHHSIRKYSGEYCGNAGGSLVKNLGGSFEDRAKLYAMMVRLNPELYGKIKLQRIERNGSNRSENRNYVSSREDSGIRGKSPEPNAEVPYDDILSNDRGVNSSVNYEETQTELPNPKNSIVPRPSIITNSVENPLNQNSSERYNGITITLKGNKGAVIEAKRDIVSHLRGLGETSNVRVNLNGPTKTIAIPNPGKSSPETIGKILGKIHGIHRFTFN